MHHRLLTAVAILPLLLVACSADAPARDADGSFSEAGDASVFVLQAGDCFDDQPELDQVVAQVRVTPCSEPHDNEIYFEYSMEEPEFPGTDRAQELAAERCLGEFEAFVGVDYLDSELGIFPITPTAESWTEGDTVVYCVLYALDLSKLEGSMRDSRR